MAFRFILVIPQLIVLAILGVVAVWPWSSAVFVVLFTGTVDGRCATSWSA